MIYFATLGGGTDRFDPGAEDVRRFHNWTSRVPTLGPNPLYAVRWVVPTLYRLPGGRWVLDVGENLSAEVTPAQALRWCAESGSVIEWENRFRWRSGDAYPLVVHDGPPEIVLEDCEEWLTAPEIERRYGIPGDRLRKAAGPDRKTRKVKSKGEGKGTLYRLADVRQAWPEECQA